MTLHTDPAAAPSRRTKPRGALARLVADPLGALGLTLIALTVLGAALAGLSPHSPTGLSPLDRFSGPTAEFWLGTDNLGRDLFTRVLYGARVALALSIGATALALVFGLVTGVAAGFGPRWADNILLLILDAMKSVPTVMLALVLVTFTGPSLWAVVLVVVLVNGPAYARMARTQTLAIRNADYIEAERSLGAGGARIVFAHVLPNILGPILILAAMDIPIVVGIEAGLSFLGLGVRPPAPSWGTILYDGFSYIRDSAWMVIAGGIPIVITALGFTFLGEALRDTFDPKLAKR
ncbi:ABC transporter permease [Pseudoroseicyclus aestuarii]|uniref:Peptide/nickel transport system permease protein n=1 Tax=Pseudoroseicyclus aestuarii TaxID=1795041 RepID=A0A318SNW0_9RHOB|nr:ABC transporter permease [Pseudoroseicyclus aestuarii]PYE82376.1 peptide/nickel transport system permease protein [Pseudoroseicyclus aestuarii]